MNFIKETVHDGIMDALEKQLNKFDEAFQHILFGYNLALAEGVTDGLDPDLDTALEQLTKRLEAARRGLGLTNKLPAGESRVIHRRKIMGNLNKIRTLFNFVQKKLDAASAEDDNSIQPQQPQRPNQAPQQPAQAPQGQAPQAPPQRQQQFR